MLRGTDTKLEATYCTVLFVGDDEHDWLADVGALLACINALCHMGRTLMTGRYYLSDDDEFRYAALDHQYRNLAELEPKALRLRPVSEPLSLVRAALIRDLTSLSSGRVSDGIVSFRVSKQSPLEIVLELASTPGVVVGILGVLLCVLPKATLKLVDGLMETYKKGFEIKISRLDCQIKEEELILARLTREAKELEVATQKEGFKSFENLQLAMQHEKLKPVSIHITLSKSDADLLSR